MFEDSSSNVKLIVRIRQPKEISKQNEFEMTMNKLYKQGLSGTGSKTPSSKNLKPAVPKSPNFNKSKYIF
jgi:hypothetical protein